MGLIAVPEWPNSHNWGHLAMPSIIMLQSCCLGQHHWQVAAQSRTTLTQTVTMTALVWCHTVMEWLRTAAGHLQWPVLHLSCWRHPRCHTSHIQKAWCYSTPTSTAKSAGSVWEYELHGVDYHRTPLGTVHLVRHVALVHIATLRNYFCMCSSINIAHIRLHLSSFIVPGILYIPSQ